MSESKLYAEVAVLLPIRKTFVYEVPPPMQTRVTPGSRVGIPFGRCFRDGFVLSLAPPIPDIKNILPIRRVWEKELAIPENLLRFLLWVSQYYLHPIGETIKTAVPSGTQAHARESYALTSKGKQILDDLPPDSPEAKIMRSLERRGGRGFIPFRLLKNPSAASSPLCDPLIEKGWMKRTDDRVEQRPKAQKISMIHFLREPEPELPLARRQKEALILIRNAGEISWREFNKTYKNSRSLLFTLQKHGLISLQAGRTDRQMIQEEIEEWMDGPPWVLSEKQKSSVDRIGQALRSQQFCPFLLHGVTGSGKTEVYLQAVHEVLAQGRQALLLVPEIALTAQLIAYFRSRIVLPMAVLHSNLSSRERADEWRRIQKGGVPLVIGVRSAIFAPLDRLGLIIVDEEHDPSYKQEEKLRYNARDLALMRGKMENAVVVLGSATPSLESYYNAQRNKFQILSLPWRIDHRPFPEIRIVDMREEQRVKGSPRILSRPLEDALRQNVENNQQALLFLNRRGFSTFALCRDCGFVYQCPNCSVSMIYHLTDKSFRCHYCGCSLPALSRCPQCSSIHLMLFGVGTQRLEEEVKKKFPQVKVGRLDRDAVTRKISHQRILNQVRRGEVNLLIGTQMITKGHDLPRVTLVGVLAADLSLNLPDFRASERTFQLLTQVAGRAGRGKLPGKVIIQTYNPQHYSVQMAKAQDFSAFYKKESQIREELGYPPYSRLVIFRLEGNVQAKMQKYVQAFSQMVGHLLAQKKIFQDHLEILGPAPAPLAKIRGKSRWQVLLKGKKWNVLHDFAAAVLKKAEEELNVSGVKLTVDVDPVNML